MRREFKVAMRFGLVLTLVGFMDLTPVPFGRFSPVIAQASEWSEGILSEVHGLPGKEGREKAIGPIEIKLDDGNTFQMDPKAKIKDIRGIPISLERLIIPCKIRFIQEKGVVKEMVLIEVLPR